MVVDLFSGTGGWDVAARGLGLDVLGIELDDVACDTREAAGLPTRHADVAELTPGQFGPAVDGLIASPPCQAWSMAGKRGGERDKHLVYRALHDLETGQDTRSEVRAGCEDERSLLVVEPLRWILALKPTWIALEQVPPVLELWQEYRQILIMRGWRVWTGVLSAERYGVPQTRRRAILMAHRDRYPAPPRPTHQAYVPGEPARGEVTLEGELLPWVSMAEALGWGMTGRPANSLVTRASRGGAVGSVLDGGSRSRAALAREREAGRWVYDRRQQSAGMSVRTIPATEPAPTIASQGLASGRDVWIFENGSRNNRARRPAHQPAPTIHFGNSLNQVEWTYARPATTVNGDPRISKPGHHDEHESGSQQKDAVRVSEREAAILQGFPPDYPFQGSRTARFVQIGNAVPPPLARAVLAELV